MNYGGKLNIYEERHERVALPCVRVRTAKGSGSGTVIYSGPDGKEGFSTYILTNHHVVANSIKVKKKWSSVVRADIKIDVFETVDVDFFRYKWMNRSVGAQTVSCDIIAYDKDEDLAVLKTRDDIERIAAYLYPKDQEHKLEIGMKLIAIGAGMGHPPVQTEGNLSQFGEEIEHKEYWLNTASIIFGNSGGSLYLKDTFEFVGVPAAGDVIMLGFSAQLISHLAYAIPITRVYEFLDKQYLRFVYDANFTEEGEFAQREHVRELQQQKLSIADMEKGDGLHGLGPFIGE